MLFNLIFQKIMQGIKEVEGGAIFRDKNTEVLAFADDGDFLDIYIQIIEYLYIPFRETDARVGLKSSEGKTTMMSVSRNNQQKQQQQNMVDIENVGEFK